MKSGKKISFRLLFSIFLISITVFGLNASITHAQTPPPVADDSEAFAGQKGILTIANEAFGSNSEPPEDIRTIAARIINAALGLMAIIFLYITVIAGYKYMTAGGDETKVKDAIGQFRTGIIGLAIILAAWGITYFISTQILEAVNLETS